MEHTPDGFAWTKESWGRGLRADALAQVAAHVFTTRDLRLASDEGGWQALAASVGARDLARLRQVHGAAAAVIRPRKWRRSGRDPRRISSSATILQSPLRCRRPIVCRC